MKQVGSGGEEYTKQALDQAIKGNYTDDVTVAGTLGDIGVGFIPVLGQLQSGRNLWHNVTHWEWTPEHIGDTFFNAVGLVPFVGGLKVLGKADKVGKLVKGAVKHGDDVAKDSKRLIVAAAKKKNQNIAKAGEDLFVGTYSQSRYGNIKNGLNSSHTPHHVIQDAISNISHGKGITINLKKELHELTETYKRMRDISPTDLRKNLAADILELRKLLRNAGYSREVINTQLSELLHQNLARGVFGKTNK